MTQYSPRQVFFGQTFSKFGQTSGGSTLTWGKTGRSLCLYKNSNWTDKSANLVGHCPMSDCYFRPCMVNWGPSCKRCENGQSVKFVLAMKCTPYSEGVLSSKSNLTSVCTVSLPYLSWQVLVHQKHVDQTISWLCLDWWILDQHQVLSHVNENVCMYNTKIQINNQQIQCD